MYAHVLAKEFSLLWSGWLMEVIIGTCLFAHSQELVFGNMVLAHSQLSFVSVCFVAFVGGGHQLAI